MLKIEIVKIDPVKSAGTKLSYQYNTDRHYEVSIDEKSPLGWSAKLELKQFPSSITKRFESQLFEPFIENPVAYLGTVDGAKAGYMQLGFESWNKRMRIWEILVYEQYRKCGLGSLFIQLAKSEAKSIGARMLVLETQSCNFPAIQFYLKSSFELIGFDLASYSNEDQKRNEVRLEFGFRL